jgi:hypothetical protein
LDELTKRTYVARRHVAGLQKPWESFNQASFAVSLIEDHVKGGMSIDEACTRLSYNRADYEQAVTVVQVARSYRKWARTKDSKYSHWQLAIKAAPDKMRPILLGEGQQNVKLRNLMFKAVKSGKLKDGKQTRMVHRFINDSHAMDLLLEDGFDEAWAFFSKGKTSNINVVFGKVRACNTLLNQRKKESVQCLSEGANQEAVNAFEDLVKTVAMMAYRSKNKRLKSVVEYAFQRAAKNVNK